MPTTSLAAARQELSAGVNGTTPEAVSFTVTTAIAADASIISTELRDAGYTKDDFFGPESQWYVIITSDANAGTVRRIVDYVETSGTLTVSGTNLTVEGAGEKATFELHKINPVLLRRILNDASRDAFPALHKPVINESIFTSSLVRRYPLPSPWNVSGTADAVRRIRQVRLFRSPFAQDYSESILKNGGFEDWTGATVDSWTATNLTIAKEEATTTPKNYAVLRGDKSVKCTAILNTAGDLTQTISTPSTHDGLTFAKLLWVYCNTAARVSLRITLNAVTTDSQNHGGTGWEPLVVVASATGATLTTLSFGLRVSSGAVIIFYADEAIALAGPRWPPYGSDSALTVWRIESQQGASPGLAAENYLVFPYQLADRYQLRIVGMDTLSQLTADTDTVEIGTPQTELWYAYAKKRLAQQMMWTEDGDRGDWQALLSQAEREIAQMRVHDVPQAPLVNLPFDMGRK